MLFGPGARPDSFQVGGLMWSDPDLGPFRLRCNVCHTVRMETVNAITMSRSRSGESVMPRFMSAAPLSLIAEDGIGPGSLSSHLPLLRPSEESPKETDNIPGRCRYRRDSNCERRAKAHYPRIHSSFIGTSYESLTL